VVPARVAQDQLSERKNVAKPGSPPADNLERDDHVQADAFKVREPIAQEVLEEIEVVDPDDVAPMPRSGPAPAPAFRQVVPETEPVAEPEGRIWAGRSKGVSRADNVVASDYDGAGTKVQHALEAPEEMAQPSGSFAAARVAADASTTGARDREVAFDKDRTLGGIQDELNSPASRTADMRERPDPGVEGIAKSEEYSRKVSGRPVTGRESAAESAAEATLSASVGVADEVRRIGVTIDRKREPELRALLARYDTGRNDKPAQEKTKTWRRAENGSTSRMAVLHGRLAQLLQALRKIGQVHTPPAQGPVGDAFAGKKAVDREPGAVVIVELEIQYSDTTDLVPRSSGD